MTRGAAGLQHKILFPSATLPACCLPRAFAAYYQPRTKTAIIPRKTKHRDRPASVLVHGAARSTALVDFAPTPSREALAVRTGQGPTQSPRLLVLECARRQRIPLAFMHTFAQHKPLPDSKSLFSSLSILEKYPPRFYKATVLATADRLFVSFSAETYERVKEEKK